MYDFYIPTAGTPSLLTSSKILLRAGTQCEPTKVYGYRSNILVIFEGISFYLGGHCNPQGFVNSFKLENVRLIAAIEGDTKTAIDNFQEGSECLDKL